jgi:hypothetical protein
LVWLRSQQLVLLEVVLLLLLGSSISAVVTRVEEAVRGKMLE